MVMIDRQAIDQLDPEERVTRLKELAEERRRELQLIDSLLKETEAELRREASLSDEEALIARQLVAAQGPERRREEIEAPSALDERITHAVLETIPEEERSKLAELAQAAVIPGLYQTPPALDTGETSKPYQRFEEYSSFKHIGYENLWQQQEDSKFKKHEQKREERNQSLL